MKLLDKLLRRPTTQPTHADNLAEARRLIRKGSNAPCNDRYLPPLEDFPMPRRNMRWEGISGVWIEAGLYYEALGIPIGRPPAGDDVADRSPGVPDSNFGRCRRCDRSWKWVEGHATWYSETEGCSPLCERCWGELTPGRRVPFYRSRFDLNNAQVANHEGGRYVRGNDEWSKIEKAVLEGK